MPLMLLPDGVAPCPHCGKTDTQGLMTVYWCERCERSFTVLESELWRKVITLKAELSKLKKGTKHAEV